MATQKVYALTPEWGPWDEFTQIRSPVPGRIEFRRSTPGGLLTGLGILIAALDASLTGLVLPLEGMGTGAIMGIVGIAVFFIGRGTDIDGRRRTVTRWWGWIYHRVISFETEFGAFESVVIAKQLGPKAPQSNIGRMVRHPISLVRKSGRRLLLKPCPWVSESRFLAEEISMLVGVTVVDESGEPADPDERVL